MHENRRHSENSKSKIFILNELLHSRQEYVNNFVVKATYELRTIISLHKIIWLLSCWRHFFAEISSILMDLFGIVTTNKSLLMKWEIKAKQYEICLVYKTKVSNFSWLFKTKMRWSEGYWLGLKWPIREELSSCVMSWDIQLIYHANCFSYLQLN